MIRSMTGYGKSQQLIARKKISVEIKALNSRQLDLSFRLPAELKQFEYELRNALVEKLHRGKIEFSISCEAGDAQPEIMIDSAMAEAAFEQLKALSKQLAIPVPDNSMELLMRFPGFFATTDVEFPEDFLENLIELSFEAFEAFDAFRQQEGSVLQEDMENRIHLILELLRKVAKFEENRTATLKQRLMRNLQDMGENTRFDENRFEQELIYYFEKLDITEEKTRLQQHCNYFLETVEELNAGKKLNFISQEIGREINTLGSKANDASIQHLVVQMKDELEKIKEQLFNVL